jgi:hypothetical protein
MATGRFRSLIATSAIVALVCLVCAPLARAQSIASWGGRVVHADRVTPRVGVVVSLTDDARERTIRAEPTRADGAFVIDGAPAGTYELTVETDEGVFVSPRPVKLESGVNPPMALALSPGRVNAKQEHGLGKESSRMTEYIAAGVIIALDIWLIFQLTEEDPQVPASVL